MKENLIEIKNEYNSLDKLYNYLKNDSNYEYSKTYDIWEMRTDSNGQMEECIVIKKSGMHAVKVFFAQENIVKVNYVIPNKLMHAYFGKSEKAYKNIIEIVTGAIKQALLKGLQQRAFDDLEKTIKRAGV